MKKICFTMFIASILCGCSSLNLYQDKSKTPKTKIGEFNSCSLYEIDELRYNNKLSESNTWTIAQEIISSCLKQLDMDREEINNTQSLNMIVSAIKALK